MKRDLWTVLLIVVVGLMLLVGMTGAVGAQNPGTAVKQPLKLDLAEPKVVAAAPSPLTKAFTYQGLLKSGGNPVNGTVDMQFGMWDQAVGGLQIGTTQTVLAVSVVNGVFTVRLNDPEVFTNAFNGQALWLEIAVRSPAGVGTYTLLTPRQEITAVPYALALAPSSVLVNNNDSTVFLSPQSMVNFSPFDLTLTPQADGSMEVAASADVTTTVSIPAALLGSLFGAQMYVKSVEVCYTGGGDGSILATKVAKSNGAGGVTNYISDATVRSATTRTCYVLNSTLPRQAINNTSWVQFDVAFIPDVLTSTLTIHSVKLTVSELAN